MSNEKNLPETIQTVPGHLTGDPSPKTSLTGVAVTLAVSLAISPGDGMRGHGRTLDDLVSLVPNESPQAVEGAAFDLEALGLVEIRRAIGKFWWLYLTQRFYEQIDKQVMGWNTYDDARTLAKLLLEDETRTRTSKLHETSGWDKRRFNPAFRALLDQISEEHISKEIQPNYPSAFVVLGPEDSASLRRFTRAMHSA
jgi:hypothetical protein